MNENVRKSTKTNENDGGAAAAQCLLSQSRNNPCRMMPTIIKTIKISGFMGANL